MMKTRQGVSCALSFVAAVLRSRRRIALGAVLLASLGGHTYAQTKTYEGSHTTVRTTSYTYDASTGLLNSETIEPGRPELCVSTAYVYDDYGNRRQAETKNCAGATGLAVFQSRSVSTDHVVLSPTGGLTQPAGVVPGAFPITAENALGHKEYKQYDPKTGQVTALKGPNGLTTSWALDQFGRKVAETRSDGSVTRTWYCFLKADGSLAADHGGNTNGSTEKEHPGLGDCTSIVSGLHGVGLVSDVTHAAGVSHFVHVQGYFSDGSIAGPYVRTYFDRRGREVRKLTQAFDGGSGTTAGKLVVVDTFYHASGAKAAETQPYFWDTKKSVIAAGDAAVDQGYGYTYTEYDVLGRPKVLYTADGSSSNSSDLVTVPATRPAALPERKASKVEYAYAGLATSITRIKTGVEGSSGAQTLVERQEKNPEGKVVRTTDALGAQQVFEYDAVGNLKRTFDAMGAGNGSSFADANVVAINYDDRGRKTAMNDPNKGVWSYKYNALGELVEQVDANSKVTKLQYDLLGRLTVRDAPDHFARFHFDKLPTGAKCSSAAASAGLLCATTTRRDGAGLGGAIEKQLSYDALLRPLGETTLLYSGAGAVERRFASSVTYQATTGRVQSQTYPTGLAIGFQYSALGFVDKVGIWNGSALVSTYWNAGTVNAWGKSESYSLGNGVVQRNEYEPQTGRMMKAQAGSGGASNVFAHRYQWDSLNNLVVRTDSFGSSGGETADSFGYDAINRLVRYTVSAPPDLVRSVTMTYNAVGNILSRSDVGNYHYPASGGKRPHAVTSVRGTLNADYSYDEVGNLVAANGGAYASIAYNSFNQPDATQGIVGRNGTRYTYVYDEDRQRIVERRTLSNGVVRATFKLHPDNAGGLAFEQEREGSGVVNRHYVTVGGVVVAMAQSAGEIYAVGQEATGSPQMSASAIARIEYWHTDHLGSVVALTDGAGQVRARYAYDPWGRRRNPSGTFEGLNPGDYPNGTDRGFTGHEHLDDIGIIHTNGRLYDPLLARFLQADPVVGDLFNSQTFNGYSYVYNRPMLLTDATGNCPICFWAIGGLLFAKATGLIDQKTFRGLMSITVGFALGPAGWGLTGTGISGAAIAGFASGAIGSGSLKGAFQGMFSSMLFYGVGSLADGLELQGLADTNFAQNSNMWSSGGIGRAALHAMAGCIQSSVSGAGCKSGALGAGVSELGLSVTKGVQDGLGRAVIQAAIGGTTSVIGGGKFGSGARSAAYGYLFNELLHVGGRHIAMRRAGYDDSGSTLVSTAMDFIGDTRWAQKGKLNFCNVFVGDMLEYSGFDAPMDSYFSLSKLGRVDIYQRAGQWGDPSFDPAGKLTGWAITSTPEAGDVFAYKWGYANATGHVGIYSGNGMGIWANATVVRAAPLRSSFDSHYYQAITYRTYVGAPN